MILRIGQRCKEENSNGKEGFTMRKGMIVGVVSLCLLSFLAGGGLAQQAVKEVRIGVAGPMKAVFGRDHWRGASIAQSTIFI